MREPHHSILKLFARSEHLLKNRTLLPRMHAGESPEALLTQQNRNLRQPPEFPPLTSATERRRRACELSTRRQRSPRQVNAGRSFAQVPAAESTLPAKQRHIQQHQPPVCRAQCTKLFSPAISATEGCE